MGDTTVPSVRIERPWTIVGGIGLPADLLRVEVTRSIGDQFSVGGAVGYGPLGLATSANGYWHALRSPTHGHSLIVGAGLNLAPGVGALAGSGHVSFGGDVSAGWEYRSRSGFTMRLSAGPALWANVVPGQEAAPPLTRPDGSVIPLTGVPATSTHLESFWAPKVALSFGGSF